MYLQRKLWQWREEQAGREGLESFKVLSKATLEAIVLALPQNKEELLQVKGIKEKKYQKYGKAILAIVAEEEKAESEKKEVARATEETSAHEPLSVSQFLEGINTELSGMAARIQGEISDVNIWQSKLVFFSLKDSHDDALVKCSISYQNYCLSGVDMKIGDEVVVEGYPKIYKPRGELSFQVITVELFGEGALKKAYDELYQKLQAQGAFDPSKKKVLPQYPERIALITSRDGAAIGDFQMNIGHFGLQIDLYPSGVEGQRAIHELIKAVQYFKKHANQYDVLVIVRGGGGLESLQAFNNEVLVTEILSMPIPTLCGIGHEKDITLASLVADQMESTPTACALALTTHFQQARQLVRTFEHTLPSVLEREIFRQKEHLAASHTFFFEQLHTLKASVITVEQQFLEHLHRQQSMTTQLGEKMSEQKKLLQKLLEQAVQEVNDVIERGGEKLKQYDPARVLRLGYSIIKNQAQVLKSTRGLKKGDILDIQLSDGLLEARIEKII
jgi:exodeoxyribonuclease VII large subunit